jgi:hypothetical protein
MALRCEALTKSGTQCKRGAVTGTTVCYMHTGESCSVCMNHMNDATSRTLGCSHRFHKSCLERWKLRSNTCPVCRAPFDEPKYNVKISIEPVDAIRVPVDPSLAGLFSVITSNLVPFTSMFGLDPHLEEFFTDIRFQVNDDASLREILNSLGFTGNQSGPDPTGLHTVGTAEL